jgi:hypothetical protein
MDEEKRCKNSSSLRSLILKKSVTKKNCKLSFFCSASGAIIIISGISFGINQKHP